MIPTLPLDSALRERLARDPHRPVFHFLPPANWMNDPNGLIYWQGWYHLYYQHNPFAAKWGPMYWGHAVSRDLLHWQHRPVALAPTPGGADADGCWSGVAVVQGDAPVFIYSGNRRVLGLGDQQRCCLATPSADLDLLTADPANPLIPDLPGEAALDQYRDHCVWREGDHWAMLIGAALRDVGGAVLLYHSPDLRHWQYVGPALQGDLNRADPLWSGTMWECPDLIPFPAQPDDVGDAGHHPDARHPDDRHALVISAYAPDELEGYTGVFWGRYDGQRFIPESYRKLDLGERAFYAPQSFVDAELLRVQFGWLGEARSEEACLEAGWAGVLSLPRVLSRSEHDSLRVQPHPALAALRGAEQRLEPFQILPGAADRLTPCGKAAEVHAVFNAPLKRGGALGLRVFATPDGAEQTLIRLDAQTRSLQVLRERSSLDQRCDQRPLGGPIELEEDEDLDLRIFLDHSVIEIFINERVTLSCRVYPTRADAVGLGWFAEGQPGEVQALSIWPYES